MTRVVVSLTTIPGRTDLLRRTIQSLRRQTRPPDAIYLWLPAERFAADDPNYRFAGVHVRSGPDLGPAMKLLPLLAIETHPDTAVIPVDDDVEYPPELIDRLLRAGAILPDHAIGFTGWTVTAGAAGLEVVHLNEDVPGAAMLQPVHVLEGYRGALYRRRFFEQDVYQHLEALDAFRFHDDILLSGYLASRGIARSVRWYGSSPAPREGYWKLNGQDIGLHTRPGWVDQGWACWNYWALRFPGSLPTPATPQRSERLQLGADLCPREGFLHHGRRAAAQLDFTNDLREIPWPWPDGSFREVLALAPLTDPPFEIAAWLRECRRILKPGGVLKFRLPIEPEGAGLGEPGYCDPFWDTSDPAARSASLGLTELGGCRFVWERAGENLEATLLKET
jgi:hypothetical protein